MPLPCWAPNLPCLRCKTRHPSPADSLEAVTADVVDCTRCERLVEWRRQVAIEKRASYRTEEYWARPVPGFGDAEARLLVVGSGPGGSWRQPDRSHLHRGPVAATGCTAPSGAPASPTNRPARRSTTVCRLEGCYITAAVRCAPPANRPTPDERDRCRPYLVRELALLSRLEVVVVLGQFAYDVMCRLLQVRPRPRFGHLAEVPVAGPRPLTIVCSYHPSQQNTFTGKLTEPMLDAVFLRVRSLLEG